MVTDNEFLMDSIQVELHDYLENGINRPIRISKIIQPGESFVIPNGTQYEASFNCVVFPNVLILQSDLANFQACENILVHNKSTGSQLS